MYGCPRVMMLDEKFKSSHFFSDNTTVDFLQTILTTGMYPGLHLKVCERNLDIVRLQLELMKL